MTFYQSGKIFPKILSITHSFISRYLLLFTIYRYDIIFIHREATPAGPPVIEWLLAKVFRKKIIYDFDDAIWLTDRTDESLPARYFKWRSKVGSICKWSHKISCGNNYLAAYAKKFNNSVFTIPTTIDTTFSQVDQRSKNPEDVNLTIGWTGSHSTLKYIESIAPVLRAIARKFPEVKFLVIADKAPDMSVTNLEFKKWVIETELSDLARMDIGLMPLPDDAWTRGKCGLKALQYLSMGIPALVSPVGVNRKIIDDGLTGYWCSSHEEWIANLEKLILDPDLRMRLGKNGKEKILTHYSVASQAANFLSLFQ